MAMTAKLATVGRARESQRPDRLFNDLLAADLAGPDGFWLMDGRLPGMSAPHLVALVRAGATFINGKHAERAGERTQAEAA
jgi:O-methyltransferase involved in polyketide biosynthesis